MSGPIWRGSRGFAWSGEPARWAELLLAHLRTKGLDRGIRTHRHPCDHPAHRDDRLLRTPRLRPRQLHLSPGSVPEGGEALVLLDVTVGTFDPGVGRADGGGDCRRGRARPSHHSSPRSRGCARSRRRSRLDRRPGNRRRDRARWWCSYLPRHRRHRRRSAGRAHLRRRTGGSAACTGEQRRGLEPAWAPVPRCPTVGVVRRPARQPPSTDARPPAVPRRDGD